MKTDPRFVGQYLSNNYSQLQNIISRADAKANIVLGLIGVILSLFFNFFVTKELIPMWQIIVVLTLFFISGFFAFLTLYPRTGKKTNNFSLTYYKDAINIDTKKITTLFMKTDVEEIITEDLINNIKELSKIIDSKFNKLKFSYIFLALGMLVKVIFETYNWSFI